jgi:hypothetical protein
MLTSGREVEAQIAYGALCKCCTTGTHISRLYKVFKGDKPTLVEEEHG